MAELPTAQNVVVDDDDTAVAYFGPDGAWMTTVAPMYHGNSCHLTFIVSAGVNFTFTGEWVWVFMDFNANHGPYTISLDGGPEMLSSSYSPTLTKSQLVFGREVEPGTHVLTLKNVVDQKVLGIDYFMYRPISNHTNTSTTGRSAATSSTPVTAQDQSHSQVPPKKLDVGSYVAIVLGVGIVALLVVVLWVFVRSRRRRSRPVLPVPTVTLPYTLHMQPAPAYMPRDEYEGCVTAPVGRRLKVQAIGCLKHEHEL